MRKIITAFMLLLCAVCMASAANYLTFTAEEDSSSFGIVNKGNHPNIEYSLDGGETWVALAAKNTVTLVKKGDKALLRGDNPDGFSHYYYDGYSSFTMTGGIAASGSVMSLIDGVGETIVIPNSDYYFTYLFKGCTSLTQAPELPATTLAISCYKEMFSGCTSLTKAPELPATTLTNFCYEGMFSGCTSLTKAPELPATKLDRACYYKMFNGCTSLTKAPELPATTLAYSCYAEMFSDCTSLTQAPELSATTLDVDCYAKMFSGCTSLTKAPELPITISGTKVSYYEMFSGCTSLSQIKVNFFKWSDATEYWVSDVAPTGTFICPKELPLEYGVSRIPEGWTVKYINDTVAGEPNYLTFTAEEDSSTFGVKNNVYMGIQYSLDGGKTWLDLKYNYGKNVVLRKKGDKAILRGQNFENSGGGKGFEMTGKIAASGSVMSLIDGVGITKVFPENTNFCYLFYRCGSALTKAPELPATTLTAGCYHDMFNGCTGLTQAPELPATTLAIGCYEQMFLGCTSLTQAPELPATTLARECYYRMFYDCTSLTQAPELPATTLPDINSSVDRGCYSEMFHGCTSLTKVPEILPATTLKGHCYLGMFSGCTSLTQAPELPATTLSDRCYEEMFKGCTSLTKVPEILPATTLAELCYYGMFNDCTSLTQAPELPATTLARACYNGMFNNCTSLDYIKVNFKVWKQQTGSWVYNVAPTGTFVCPKILFVEYGSNRIPEGWTVKYIDDVTPDNANYLTFTAEEDSSSFGIVNYVDGIENNKEKVPDIRYSLDNGETWSMLTPNSPITLAKKGEKALLMGYNPTGLSTGGDYGDYTKFTMTGKIAANGSVMSLIDGFGYDTIIPNMYCFYRLFCKCTSLTQGPALTATELKYNCYSEIFIGCTNMKRMLGIHATEVAQRAFVLAFSGCTSLIEAPELSATTLDSYCYNGMFSGCTNLVEAPELPATTLAEHCYFGMFKDCTSLTKAPELPATTLADYCYYRMFSGCTSLTKAPKLSATALPEGCYYQMFSGCTNLSQINVSFDDWSHNSATSNWVESVAPTGTFICPKNLSLEYGIDRIPEEWTVKYIEDEPNYLTFTAEEDNVSVAVTESEQNGGDIQPAPYPQVSDDTTVESMSGAERLFERRNLPAMSTDLKYSTDGGETWTEMVPGTPVILAKKGDKILFKGNNPSGFSTETQRIQFDIEGKVSASGSVMSLIDETGVATTIPNEYCFASLFENCAGLTKMPDLNATQLKAYCYKDMFRGCTSLRSTTMLPATTLEEGSYEEMFFDCENLSEVNVSFSDWTDGTKDWLHGVASEGKVISPANLAPTTGDDYVPDGWSLVSDSIITVLSEALADGLIVWTQDHTIYVKGAKGEISLYDPTGKILLISNSSAEDIRTLRVPSKGVYVVKTNEKSLITVVR